MSFIFRLARPHPLRLSVGLGLCVSTLLYADPFLARRPALVHRCDAGPQSFSSQYQREAQNPVVKGGRVNPRIFKQLSAGSIIGLLGGLAVSLLSKPLAIILGLLVLGAQALESKGIHVIPYQRIQRAFSSVDVKSALQDNVAFKVAFGTTFALAGFAEL